MSKSDAEVCANCSGDLTKDDLYVFSRSTMSSPWCNVCVQEENSRFLEERPSNAPRGYFTQLPRYLR
jgi:hypothetical protein